MKSVEEYSTQDISLMEFREKLFREEIERYTAAITGERESILPFVRDESGRYSEEKTWDFIRELTHCAYIYWEYSKEQLRQAERAEGTMEEFIELTYGAAAAFSPQEEEFLQSFLYCALRVSEANPWRNTGGGTQTFQDLIRFAGERYSSQIQLYVEEATAEAAGNRYANLKGLYRPASWLYHLLTGGYLSDLYPEESRKDYFGQLPFYLQAELGNWSRTPSAYAREMDALCSDPELFAADSEEPAIRSPEGLEREHEEQRLRQEEASQIREQFAQPEEFVRRYLHFKNRQYAVNYDYGDIPDVGEFSLESIIDTLPALIQGAVRLFTESHGLSHIQDDNAYFTAVSLLRQSNKRFRKLSRKPEEVDSHG